MGAHYEEVVLAALGNPQDRLRDDPPLETGYDAEVGREIAYRLAQNLFVQIGEVRRPRHASSNRARSWWNDAQEGYPRMLVVSQLDGMAQRGFGIGRAVKGDKDAPVATHLIGFR